MMDLSGLFAAIALLVSTLVTPAVSAAHTATVAGLEAAHAQVRALLPAGGPSQTTAQVTTQDTTEAVDQTVAQVASLATQLAADQGTARTTAQASAQAATQGTGQAADQGTGLAASLAAQLAADLSPPAILSTTMTGAQEVPGPGDPDGRGTATIALLPDGRTLCYLLTATGIEPATAAHIHRGGPTEAGPVVVPLSPPTSGISGGCTTIDPALHEAIRTNPSGFYVNVHNMPYPAGAIRGQL